MSEPAEGKLTGAEHGAPLESGPEQIASAEELEDFASNLGAVIVYNATLFWTPEAI